MNRKESMDLLTVGGFIRHFYTIIRDNPDMTHYQAYELAEDEFQKHFGKRKYSCFESFRIMKNRYTKKRSH